MQDFYFFLSSKASRHLLPNSSSLDFTTILPNQVHLRRWDQDGAPLRWTIAITDFAIENKESLFANTATFAILCDLASESYIRGKYLPVLRIVKEEAFPVTSLSLPYYIGLNNLSFNSIRIYVLGEDLQTIIGDNLTTHVSCTLHIQAMRL